MLHATKSLVTLCLSALAATVAAQAQMPVDDLRVRQLEAEVLRLQQQVDAQTRRIERLEQEARLASPGPPTISGIRAPDTSPVWLVTANWDRVKTGMTALEVIAILGRPTSTRNDGDGRLRVLFYAMELGPDRYLSGNVRLDDEGVAEVNRPVLR